MCGKRSQNILRFHLRFTNCNLTWKKKKGEWKKKWPIHWPYGKLVMKLEKELFFFQGRTIESANSSKLGTWKQECMADGFQPWEMWSPPDYEEEKTCYFFIISSMALLLKVQKLQNNLGVNNTDDCHVGTDNYPPGQLPTFSNIFFFFFFFFFLW